VVEAGKHFDEVLKPRLVRYTYASEYSGKGPMRQDGLSVLKKYIRLESYEDCLDNLSLSRTAGQQQLLDQHDRLREEYMLHYMVDVETEGSLLDTRSFDRPFDYTLSVVRDDERKTVPVDLVETFNYLLGLRVKTRDRKRGVLEIIGLSPEGEMVLVLWRNVDEVDSDALDEWFRKQGYNSRDLEFQTIYINGDNNIENQRQTDETWKVRLSEEHFHKLMFDVEGM
jgi:adenine-specific DNA-methyltransferase